MKTKTLIILLLVGLAQAQTWPSGAVPDLTAGAKPVPAGRFRLAGFGSSLANDFWEDTRMGASFELGVARGLALSAATSNRDLAGHGAFQNGAEDARLGLAVWPLSYEDRLAIGLNGQLVLPTGFRDEQSFYDSTSNQVIALPSYSLEQTGGQLSLGTVWTPGRTAELSGFAGCFGTSDNSEQAMRWGLGLSLTPFGDRIGASVAYAQSITRVGKLPDTEVLRGGLDLKLPWGFGLHPGMYAELEDDPMIGGAVALSFSGRLPLSMFPTKPAPREPEFRNGAILIPPPLSKKPLNDNDELWTQLRESLAASFDYVQPLASLDRPGLLFDEMDRTNFWNTMAAISAAFPNTRWLLVTHVEDETVSRGNGLSIPLLVTQPKWEAACKLRVQLVDLFEQTAYPERIVMATALLNDGLRSPFVSTVEKEKLSAERKREITLRAYQNAGREVALSLPPREENE
ncbi:MAG: hypothetical protein H6505_03730 [Calditrichaeota bacterium]|nr:hypothetical protein [Calditrichota bacterium]